MKNALIPWFLLAISSGMAAEECARNWTRYERTKSCLMVLPQRLRWAEAEQMCVKFGGHLASITDEYENVFAFDLAKSANLTVQTVWLGKIVEFTKSGAYKWNDGEVGRNADGFREPPSGNDLCLTMWLDFDRPDGSWNEWDCGYATGYSALCKKSYKSTVRAPAPTPGQMLQQIKAVVPGVHEANRCCVGSSNASCQRCPLRQRCIPDDLDCWTKACDNNLGWCIPLPP
uniref:C-type lectin domain-containing protein n=1 Tax=Plectus sambesii TaxID=2011161 RepID=A0A914X1D8_9BILA